MSISDRLKITQDRPTLAQITILGMLESRVSMKFDELNEPFQNVALTREILWALHLARLIRMDYAEDSYRPFVKILPLGLEVLRQDREIFGTP